MSNADLVIPSERYSYNEKFHLISAEKSYHHRPPGCNAKTKFRRRMNRRHSKRKRYIPVRLICKLDAGRTRRDIHTWEDVCHSLFVPKLVDIRFHPRATSERTLRVHKRVVSVVSHMIYVRNTVGFQSTFSRERRTRTFFLPSRFYRVSRPRVVEMENCGLLEPFVLEFFLFFSFGWTSEAEP